MSPTIAGHARVGLATLALALLAGVWVTAGDWPQYLGPDRNGVYSGPAIADTWGPGGPRVVWRKAVGQGFAGPAVSGDRLLLFHRVGNEEVVEALDAGTGDAIWRYAYPTTYRDDFGFDEGPRAVPVVSGGLVYTFGAQGQLHAIDLESGARRWSQDTMREFRVPKGFFGAGGSPLVTRGLVIANIGGEGAGMVAFDAATGSVVWKATEDDASYSSGVLATIGGRQAAVFLTRDNLLGLDPATGTVQFARRWRARSDSSVNAATPLVVGNDIFVSSEYGPGAGVIEVDGSSLEELWTSDEVLSNHYATSVYRDGYLYGFHGRQEFGQSLRAVEFRTGRVAWNVDRFLAGSVTLAGDRLLIVREVGEVLVAPATPEAFRPTARAQVLSGIVRPYPAVSDGFLYVRNENTLLCLDLRRP